MLASHRRYFWIFNLAHNPSSCICNVSIYAQLPSGSCLFFATHKPYWPPGVPPPLCLSLGRSRLVDVGVLCSLHMWHPSPATVQYGSGSAHLTGVHVSEPPVLQQARTETGLLDYTLAVLDEVSQLGRKEINTKNDKKLTFNQGYEQTRETRWKTIDTHQNHSYKRPPVYLLKRRPPPAHNPDSLLEALK